MAQRVKEQAANPAKAQMVKERTDPRKLNNWIFSFLIFSLGILFVLKTLRKDLLILCV